MYLLFPDMLLTQCNWFKMPGFEHFFEDLGEHAGEVETSLMMHLHPELVLPLEEAGTGKAKKFRITALNQGWIWAEREWSKVTADTGIGNPAKATAEKGEILFQFLTEKISDFLVELAEADLGICMNRNYKLKITNYRLRAHSILILIFNLQFFTPPPKPQNPQTSPSTASGRWNLRQGRYPAYARSGDVSGFPA